MNKTGQTKSATVFLFELHSRKTLTEHLRACIAQFPCVSGATYGIHCSKCNLRHNFIPVAVCDIGSASFKYDMRRLLEILALPKAWYRRSLARRMFLGEEPTVPDDGSQSGNVHTLFVLVVNSYILCN